MMVKVGVNRFGRIGHLVARAAFTSGKGEIVSISDPFIDLNYMVYVFQYDFIHNKFKGTVKAENGKLVINGQAITVFQERDPADVKWGDAGVEYVESTKYVVESTSVFTTMEKAGAQLKGGAKRVIISAPSAHAPHVCDGCVPWQGSCGKMAVELPRTSSLHPLVLPKAVGKVIPELNGKLMGSYPSVSVVDLTCCLEKAAKYEDIKKVVKQASKDLLKGILGYTEDQVVSCDFNSDSNFSTFNAGAGIGSQ
ncbi:hypothetical protein U0070_014650 [Myodes glareolus]|uniref:glyceraldehyde-3-phosphate dehydrogenase (phosphorylating) n=1 Tax=Myodes glareolus TaxID=447135 RepID=A0AAW0IUQ5_MYOGA